MTRALIGGFIHEVHTFVDGALSLDDMRRNGVALEGPDALVSLARKRGNARENY